MGLSQSKTSEICKFRKALADRNEQLITQFIINKEFNQYIDTNGFNSLMYAIDDKREDVAEIILQYGTRTDIVSNSGYVTPLMLSITHGFPNLAAKILATNCNIYTKDADGNNAFMLACLQNLPSVANLIWTKYGGQSLVLQSNDGEINYTKPPTGHFMKNNNGETPLILACYAGLEDIALSLIDMCRTDVQYKNVNGRSAEDYAISHNLHRVVMKLKETKPEPEGVNYSKQYSDPVYMPQPTTPPPYSSYMFRPTPPPPVYPVYTTSSPPPYWNPSESLSYIGQIHMPIPTAPPMQYPYS